MENAIFLTNTGYLDHANKGYSRLYFGQEFCERLLPLPNELSKAVSCAKDTKIGFTLVTPYVTEKGLNQTRELLSLLVNRMPGAEVVINDWGVLHLVNDEFQKLQPILGRLLYKQKRDPRISLLKNKRAIAQFPNCAFIEFLIQNRIKRVDSDTFPLFSCTGLNNPIIEGSLYYPFTYVATTRSCVLAGCENNQRKNLSGVFPCQKECQRFTFIIQSKMFPVNLFLKGNTQFFKNEKVPSNLEEKGINRLVRQLQIPI